MSVNRGGGVVMLDHSSTVTFLHNKNAVPSKRTYKSEAKLALLYKSAVSAADRVRANVQLPGPPVKVHLDLELNDCRIRFAQHDKTTLLQQRAHETFKALSGATEGQARTDVMITATRTPRARLHALSMHFMVPHDDLKRSKIDNRFARKRKIRAAANILKSQLMPLFANIYDAFSFFDIDGDWNLSTTEFLVGLRKLRIDTSDLTKELAESHNGVGLMRTLDTHNMSVVDPKTFIKLLSWHPLHPDWPRALEESRENRKKVEARVESMLINLLQQRSYASLEQHAGVKFDRKQHQHRTNMHHSLLPTPASDGLGSAAELQVAVGGESERDACAPDSDSEASSRPQTGSTGCTDTDSPGKIRSHFAASSMQKREKEMQRQGTLKQNSSSGARGECQASGAQAQTPQQLAAQTQELIQRLTQRLMDKDQPSLGGRKLDLEEQLDLSSIKAERAKRVSQRGQVNSQIDSSPLVRGRRLDDNVTLAMTEFALARSNWMLSLFDYLCVRIDETGRRTSRIGEGKVCADISVPDTVVYRQHSIAAWYFSDSAAGGKMTKKQHSKEFTAYNILTSFQSPDPLHLGSKLSNQLKGEAGASEEASSSEIVKSDEAVASFTEVIEGGGGGTTVTWLTRPALERFLHRHQKPRDGILQRFVHPHQVCVQARTRVYIHTHTHTYAEVRLCVCVCMYVCIYTYIV
jgi:hypothetical protein